MPNIGPVNAESALEDHARWRVQEIKGFYLHAAVYCVVNVGLLVVYIFGSAGSFWPIWPILGWGAGLGIHFLSAWRMLPTLFTEEWEQRKLKQIVEKEKKALGRTAAKK